MKLKKSNVLISQWVPMNPSGHEQTYESPVEMQVPLLAQVEFEHMSVDTSQNWPAIQRRHQMSNGWSDEMTD